MTQHGTTLDEVLALRAENAILKSVIAEAASQVTRIAFDMPPPNRFTPDLVMIAQGMERHINSR